jgi:hypothetical protein
MSQIAYLLPCLGLLKPLGDFRVGNMRSSGIVCVGRSGLQASLLFRLGLEVGRVVGSSRVREDTEL